MYPGSPTEIRLWPTAGPPVSIGERRRRIRAGPQNKGTSAAVSHHIRARLAARAPTRGQFTHTGISNLSPGDRCWSSLSSGRSRRGRGGPCRGRRRDAPCPYSRTAAGGACPPARRRRPDRPRGTSWRLGSPHRPPDGTAPGNPAPAPAPDPGNPAPAPGSSVQLLILETQLLTLTVQSSFCSWKPSSRSSHPSPASVLGSLAPATITPASVAVAPALVLVPQLGLHLAPQLVGR